MDTSNPVTADGVLLLETYIHRQPVSVSFCDFHRTWRELGFPLIYWSGNDRVQKAEMIQLLLEVGVSYVCADNKVEVRVAGLYLLYAVYFTQPCSPKVLVRLTLDHWCVLQQLHAELRQSKLYEADYALCRLRANSAFAYCCTPHPMCMTNWSVERPSDPPHCKHPSSTPSLLDRLQQEVDRETCEYKKLKQQLADFLPPHLLQETSHHDPNSHHDSTSHHDPNT